MSKKIMIALLVLFLAVLACNLPSPTTPVPVFEEGYAMTAVALTVSAQQTKDAPAILIITVTPPGLIPTIPPSSPLPTLTFTPIASPTNTSLPCNTVKFVSDVTYPDNTKVKVGTSFTKTWRLKNTGSCAWTSGYQLIFDGGDQMSGPASQTLTSGTVAPGATLDVSVTLTAPASPGTYRGNWKIREPGGSVFGLSSGPFWVQIEAVNITSSIPGWPTYKKGNSGPEVYAIQYLLRVHGQVLTADGIFGNKTQAAVKLFQTGAGLTADGIVGPKTWSKLIQGVTLSSGSSGDGVRAIQTLLNSKYGSALAVDGAFGAQTRLAVINFQSAHGLTADGIVGPQTWQALISY
jgi:hypothetical protein